MKPFGFLLTIDLYDCDFDCHDLKGCFQFLMDLTDKLNMKRQSPPFIFINDEYPEKAGISGWVPLIESGIQIHTLAPKKFISIDIYTCGCFESGNIVDWVKLYFKAKKVETNYLERGIEYYVET